jgi:hypothetical protein
MFMLWDWKGGGELLLAGDWGSGHENLGKTVDFILRNQKNRLILTQASSCSATMPDSSMLAL